MFCLGPTANKRSKVSEFLKITEAVALGREKSHIKRQIQLAFPRRFTRPHVSDHGPESAVGGGRLLEWAYGRSEDGWFKRRRQLEFDLPRLARLSGEHNFQRTELY